MGSEAIQITVHRALQYVAILLLSIVTYFAHKTDARIETAIAKVQELEKSDALQNQLLGIISAKNKQPFQP